MISLIYNYLPDLSALYYSYFFIIVSSSLAAILLCLVLFEAVTPKYIAAPMDAAVDRK
jgi:hypothetical protein